MAVIPRLVIMPIKLVVIILVQIQAPAHPAIIKLPHGTAAAIPATTVTAEKFIKNNGLAV